MMIRLILDEAADKCVRELMDLTAAENVGVVFQEALTIYRAVVHAGDAFEKAADVFARLGNDQPDIEVTEHAYENNPA
jgi:hypothetical protein